MERTERTHNLDKDDKETYSPIPTKFTYLEPIVETTSTPLLPRTTSKTEFELRQDSGFSEISSLLLSHSQCNDTLCETNVEQHECKKQIDCSSSHCENSSPKSVKTDLSRDQSVRLHQARLERMKSYYDKLNNSSPVAKRIGRRVGEEFVDIISELTNQQIPAISRILYLLSDKDLLRFEKVSKSWRWALYNDRLSKDRLQKFAEKENSSPKKEEANCSSQVATTGTPLNSIQLTSNVSPHNSPTPSPEDWVPENAMFHRFTKAAQKLKTGQQFVKCIRCSGPAKLYPEARQATCASAGCKYNYCTMCELEFHGASDCITRRNKKTKTQEKPISSKASKKHLKRL